MAKSKKKKGKSQNRGLPKHIIQQYGTPKQWTMISQNTWDEFYKTTEGQSRLSKLIDRASDKSTVLSARIAITEQPAAPRTQQAIEGAVAANTRAKMNARKRARDTLNR